jgi:hypothetical protein
MDINKELLLPVYCGKCLSHKVVQLGQEMWQSFQKLIDVKLETEEVEKTTVKRLLY